LGCKVGAMEDSVIELEGVGREVRWQMMDGR